MLGGWLGFGEEGIGFVGKAMGSWRCVGVIGGGMVGILCWLGIDDDDECYYYCS